ncbi:carbohydrate ABC transporter permease [Saccharibacillus sp. JS10]|uniref:carbohydrate ABC transporter permease n=1 Tax=Saccharibacillus sp. JS10 TaxID=2950552 RepID=UPI00210BEAB4|nr:sugar ABC transporter permease [Saccharibacillus sp. JS10]MCQ4086359.1 sugar ABC transporter permease [Saccharibacillus sp. JS10]
MSGSYKRQRVIILIAFLAIPLLLLGTFSYYPAAKLLYLSFTDWDGISSTVEFLGLDNYREIFSNPDLFGVFLHQIPYVLGGILQNIIAITFAVILNSRIKGRNLFRVLLFVPYIMNGVAVAFMFQYVFDTNNGSLNALLGNLGLYNLQQSWLGETSLVNFSLASVSMWRYVGYTMIIYLGALQSIPGDMYEAATIDGANRFQSFWHLTLPSLSNVIQLNMFLTLSGALAVFDLPFVLTKGGPAGASETFLLKTTETAFTFNNYGLASAMSIVLLGLTIVILLVQNLVLRRRGRD